MSEVVEHLPDPLETSRYLWIFRPSAIHLFVLRASLQSLPSAAGEAAVTDAIVKAFAPYCTSEGGYRFEIEWRYVTATVEATSWRRRLCPNSPHRLSDKDQIVPNSVQAWS